MKREQEIGTELIDLGAATEATKGGWGLFTDEVIMQEQPGLSND
jgi:hypothetical protein